ncbi:hypothetical protein IWZ01DRAFT_34825 [Phyllosticta capitalensis]
MGFERTLHSLTGSSGVVFKWCSCIVTRKVRKLITTVITQVARLWILFDDYCLLVLQMRPWSLPRKERSADALLEHLIPNSLAMNIFPFHFTRISVYLSRAPIPSIHHPLLLLQSIAMLLRTAPRKPMPEAQSSSLIADTFPRNKCNLLPTHTASTADLSNLCFVVSCPLAAVSWRDTPHRLRAAPTDPESEEPSERTRNDCVGDFCTISGFVFSWSLDHRSRFVASWHLRQSETIMSPWCARVFGGSE